MVQGNNYKKGAASLYVVIFTTLLLSIITMSFIRIMLSEATQTSNSDLSQSAYDSALAGIEDAKVALLRYNECLSDGETVDSQGACGNIIRTIQKASVDESCNVVRDVLGRETGPEGETIIQTEDKGGKTGDELQQAYTCVTISEENDDYLGQLNSNYRTKVIPIRTSSLDSVTSVKLQWFSDENGGITSNNSTNKKIDNNNLNKAKYNDTNVGLFDRAKTPAPEEPSTLNFQLIQADDTFNLTDFNTNSGASGANTNRGKLTLYPHVNGVSSIGNSATLGLAASADESPNNAIAVSCANSGAFHCSVEITLPKPVKGGSRNDGAAFIVLTLPYGAPETDFSLTLQNESKKTIQFVGVQAKIDSTGRANDLFRRVESRVELVDVYFPFPEFAATLNGDDDDLLSKNFWVTINPWGGNTSGIAEKEYE